MTIDTLGAAKIKHLQQTHDLKSYRNACRVVKQLQPYVIETFHNKEKVLYLNKDGRELIGSTREMKKNMLLDHTLLCNDAYLYFNCPIDWQRECPLEAKEPVATGYGIQFKGISLPDKKKVIADASFTRNGYLHLVEIDNTRGMADNRKKIDAYVKVLPSIKEERGLVPVLYFFTLTEARKRKLEGWMKEKNIYGQVHTFSSIS